MNKYIYKHPVFVLDAEINGYGVARSLSKYGIKVVGFAYDRFGVINFCKLFHKLVKLKGDYASYLEILINEAKEYKENKPVLIITADLFHEFVRIYYNELKQHFIFEIPSYDNLKIYLEKDLFNDLALQLDAKIPYGFNINKDVGIDKITPLVTYPALIKPKYRNEAWTKKYSWQKLIVANDENELIKVCNDLFVIVDDLIIQEWIPGPDSNIYYCLMYVTPQGEVLSHFCGRKIHQEPILIGSTASAKAANEPIVVNESIRILNREGNFGFCSVEFKKHSVTGEFYVIEPTVGRIDSQEFTAVIGGVDIVLSAYCHMLGIPVPKSKNEVKNYYYAEESGEIEAILEYIHFGKLTWSKYFKMLGRHKMRFLYVNWRDPIVSIVVIGSKIRQLIKAAFKKKHRDKNYDDGIKKLFDTFDGIGY